MESFILNDGGMSWHPEKVKDDNLMVSSVQSRKKVTDTKTHRRQQARNGNLHNPILSKKGVPKKRSEDASDRWGRKRGG